MADSLINMGNVMDSAVDAAGQSRIRRLSEKVEGPQETREGLQKAAKEFEGVFLNTLMNAMRKTVPDNKMLNSSGPTKFYQQMYDAEMAKALANGSTGIGIAEMIERQFESNLAAQTTGEMGGPQIQPNHPPVGPPSPSHLNRYRTLAPAASEILQMRKLQMRADDMSTTYQDTLAQYKDEISTASKATGVDPALILAVVVQESSGRQDAVSPKGAQGLMQLMPKTAEYLGVQDPLNPAENIMGGARYLSKMLERYDGRLDLGLAAYNAGPGNVDKAGNQIPNFRETRNYVRKILDNYNNLGGGMNLATDSQRVPVNNP